MKKELCAVTSIVFLSVAVLVYGQGQTPVEVSTPGTPSAQRVLMDRYCVGCHNQRTSNGLALDGRSLDLGHVGQSPELFEKVVRKLRAGMMPPSGAPRPAPADLEALTTWLEN